MVMVAWGDKWLAGAAGPPVLYRHHACGEISRVDLRCAHCGEPMHAGDVELLPGPGAAPLDRDRRRDGPADGRPHRRDEGGRVGGASWRHATTPSGRTSTADSAPSR